MRGPSKKLKTQICYDFHSIEANMRAGECYGIVSEENGESFDNERDNNDVH